MDLTGKRVLITAAAQGIGRASAEAYLAAGAEVIAADINQQALADLSGAQTVLLDVTDASAIQRLAAEIGPLDVLFNCAGVVHAGNILECAESDWTFALDLNVTAMYRMIRAFLPGMLAAGGGSIINMSSVASSLKGVPNRFAYCASKAAVIGLTKSVAADFVTQRIRCNAICPGTVESPSLQQRIIEQASREGRQQDEVYAAFTARQPMGRLGTPQEIAQLALYLGSDASAFTTGTTQVIDGGWSN
ncbi:SDR family oxidoreductase [Pseudomonas sp. CBSPBW29]|uniref:SDR family oxidoreductase n=1 Tax=Pseudomonas TaxID=286 RepID=UPI0021ACA86E|nr:MULTISPECIES: SDR family oxidoreductase [unclassified Pseudomonas]WEL42622.1 SDR family oxidoreductase [Pseudomonas sp. CBSPBW29]WEL63696.1 SDR family oxidoreductase [Pseudomonas sp. CBSPGW29]WEL72882.1 SDR family oxidoreductase [Pseudomonas sp. CBSPCGW29]WEL74193.1 SDR family oxidoreductase [Pseudomonas sp. CBSPAW29]WEL81570.1 SDR family oxidoreductase [Pseudomonas sp. CBSPCAW29]WEL90060.1 SDR family oxidoreductase [Pseudomonas sp. CBSPCBW29]